MLKEETGSRNSVKPCGEGFIAEVKFQLFFFLLFSEQGVIYQVDEEKVRSDRGSKLMYIKQLKSNS